MQDRLRGAVAQRQASRRSELPRHLPRPCSADTSQLSTEAFIETGAGPKVTTPAGLSVRL
jgi:hypothetical protein